MGFVNILLDKESHIGIDLEGKSIILPWIKRIWRRLYAQEDINDQW